MRLAPCALFLLLAVLSDAVTYRKKSHKYRVEKSEENPPAPSYKKLCSGSQNGRSTTETWSKDRNARLEHLRRQYINCTVVYGSLELTHIEVETNNVTGEVNFASVDLSFLEHIEEITGYLLIYSNAVDRISLPRLKIVWGDEQFEGAGMQITNNVNLKYISMPNFRSLERGTFNVSGNPRLCHFQDRIEYSEILGRDFRNRLNMEDPPAVGKFLPNFHFCDSEPLTNCSESCQGNCWGPQEDECQIIYRSICPSRCDSGMCFLSDGETKCCDRSCAGGCFGEGKRKCTACSAFLQDGECVDMCNGLTKYDRIKGITVEHDKKRYTYDRYCVEKCPEETLIQGDHCVVHCSPGFYHDPEKNTRVCEKCDGVCPKTCTITRALTAQWFTDPENRNCTVIDGHLMILAHAFEAHRDDLGQPVGALTNEHLATLRSVTAITEYLYVSAGDNSPVNLSFLRNLEVIEGRRLVNQRHAVVIASNTNLRELQLAKLRRIRKGDVLINGNSWLCYADSIPYAEVLKINGSVKIAENKEPQLCAKQGLVCAKSCNQTLGCWGDGPSMCVECEKYKKHGECVSTCPSKGFYKNETSKECLSCHEECETCSGPGDRNCGVCRHVSIKQGERTQCVLDCPKSHFRNGAICVPCHESCYENGCTGPGSFAGPGGCKLCKYAYKLDNVTEEFQCIMAKNAPQEVCQDNNLTNYYLSGGSSLADQYVCERCNSECVSCRQFGDFVEKSECKCRNYEMRSHVAAEKTRCVSDCGPGSMIVVNRTGEKAGICQKCHQFCDQKRSCSGPFESDCDACEFGIHDAAGVLKCLPECPPELPYTDEGLCREVDPAKEEQKRLYMMSVWIGVILLLCVIGCAILGYHAKKNRRLYKQELEMNPPSIPPQDPYDPDARPNMSRLTIIPGENLLRFSEELGHGAFGVVYKGYLYPKGKHSGKVPVAIKYLKTRKSDGSAEKEMLEEAGLMASMNHKHLLKIAGICLVDGVSIVTPYRMYGCLLDFLRKHQKNLFAKDLLLYCYQISDAMEYLHQHKMVHRDLAARNVLVKRPNHVEVTDFGLAKMLKKDEDSIEVSGLVAPKWLAIECFEKRIFNEKTDVWAFGVTCHEILTKGCVPYKNMRKEIHEFLLGGSRLEIPNNVSQQVYNVMLRCWLVHPAARPSFSELKKIFEEFCRQPSMYVKDASQKNAVQSAREMQKAMETYDQEPFVAGENSDNESIIDPLLYDPMPSDESPHGSPLSPSKPLLPRGQRRLPSEESTRYHSEPRGHNMPGTSFIRINKSDYMEPRSQSHNANPAELYTPVINEETGRTELSPVEYYNDPATKMTLYENGGLAHDARYQNEEIACVSNPSYVAADQVQQKETTL